MIKIKLLMMLAACVGVAIGAYGAGQDTWSGTFYTVGPDKYSDGTTVLNDEYYALVWRDSRVPFKGFRENGDLVDEENGELELAEPLAKNGAMQKFTFDLNWTEKKFDGNGMFSIYVLDTRRFGNPSYTYAADGTVLSATTNAVLAGTLSVQGYTEAGGFAEISMIGKSGNVTGTTVGKTYLLSTIDNTIITAPKITNMRFEGETIVLTVTGTKKNIAYNAVGAERIEDASAGKAGARVGVAPVGGAATEVDSIEIRVRRKAGAASEFFKIIRNPQN